MKFKKIKSTLHQARGDRGIFQITKSCGRWWGRYYGLKNDKNFRMPPMIKLKDAKQICEENEYWEDE